MQEKKIIGFSWKSVFIDVRIFSWTTVYTYISVNTYVIRPLTIGSPNLRMLRIKFHNIWLKFYCRWCSFYFNHSKLFIERPLVNKNSLNIYCPLLYMKKKILIRKQMIGELVFCKRPIASVSLNSRGYLVVHGVVTNTSLDESENR